MRDDDSLGSLSEGKRRNRGGKKGNPEGVASSVFSPKLRKKKSAKKKK
jgi:hypothetical protein